VASTPAPIRETLAAALLYAAGYRGDRPLVDPMCGSGTILIEAALMACRLAPGRRRRFAFQRWPRFGATERAAFARRLEEADARALDRAPQPLVGSDRDAQAIDAARKNAAAAGAAVAASIEWRVADAREVGPTDPPGVILSNVPYGERLAEGGLEAFFRVFGARLRTLDGHTAFLLGAERGKGGLSRVIGMRPTWSRKFMNGPIPVSLHRYELGRQQRRRGS
jgi:putative N6-adenine-specific DNA methylase